METRGVSADKSAVTHDFQMLLVKDSRLYRVFRITVRVTRHTLAPLILYNLLIPTFRNFSY